jgi:hypothetical protein
MSLKDRVVETYQRQWQELHGRLVRANPGPANGSAVGDALVTLSSIDMTVEIYEDCLSYRRRLGSKHGVIPFDHIRTASLTTRSLALNTRSTSLKFEPSNVVTKTMVLTFGPGHKNVTFDFRSEPIIRRGVAATGTRFDGRDITTREANDPPRSRADELIKLAELRKAGVLSDEEFESEKARILNP